MKNTLIASLFLIGLICMLPFGCSTTGGGTQTEQVVITEAAYLGTLYEIQQNPGARTPLAAAAGVLQAYSTGNGIPAGTVEQVLANSGITNNVFASAAIVSFINLADAYALGSTNGVNQNLQQVSGWVATGIGQGLGTVTVKNKIKLNR